MFMFEDKGEHQGEEGGGNTLKTVLLLSHIKGGQNVNWEHQQAF